MQWPALVLPQTHTQPGGTPSPNTAKCIRLDPATRLHLYDPLFFSLSVFVRVWVWVWVCLSVCLSGYGNVCFVVFEVQPGLCWGIKMHFMQAEECITSFAFGTDLLSFIIISFFVHSLLQIRSHPPFPPLGSRIPILEAPPPPTSRSLVPHWWWWWWWWWWWSFGGGDCSVVCWDPPVPPQKGT